MCGCRENKYKQLLFEDEHFRSSISTFVLFKLSDNLYIDIKGLILVHWLVEDGHLLQYVRFVLILYLC